MRPEKQLLLDEIQDKIERFDSFLITRYQNLDSNLANEFRRSVGKFGGDFEVVRKRVFSKAVQEKQISVDAKYLEGHVGIVFSGEDPLETTQGVFDFKKKYPETLDVLAGQLNGVFYDGTDIEKLSKLPSKDVMRAELLGLFEAPMSQTLSVMEALLTTVLHCLQNKIAKEEM